MFKWPILIFSLPRVGIFVFNLDFTFLYFLFLYLLLFYCCMLPKLMFYEMRGYINSINKLVDHGNEKDIYFN